MPTATQRSKITLSNVTGDVLFAVVNRKFSILILLHQPNSSSSPLEHVLRLSSSIPHPPGLLLTSLFTSFQCLRSISLHVVDPFMMYYLRV